MIVGTYDRRQFGLGARQRPHDPYELAYRLPVSILGVDLGQGRSLAPFLPRVEDQGAMGSCVANAVTSAAELLARIGGAAPPELDRLWLYARSRQREGSFPTDAGSYPADALDLAMTGLPPESAERLGYIADPTYNPGPEVDAQATYDFVAAHRPFYQTDPGGFLAGIWTALDAHLPVVLAMAWHQDFFAPVAGVLPVRTADAGIVGGHCIYAWGWQPERRLVWCRNSWGVSWTGSEVKTTNPEACSGDFAIPEALFQNGIVWECRAVSPEPVTPVPPGPGPGPTHDDYARAEGIVGHLRDVADAAHAKAPRNTKARDRAGMMHEVVQALIDGRPTD